MATGIGCSAAKAISVAMDVFGTDPSRFIEDRFISRPIETLGLSIPETAIA